MDFVANAGVRHTGKKTRGGAPPPWRSYVRKLNFRFAWVKFSGTRSSAEQQAESSMAANKSMILVVDDEPSSRETLEMAVRSWGYDVCLARDGEEALSVYVNRQPSIVISDVVMPRLDGLGLLRSLKEIDPATHVILVTAYGKINDALLAMREGALDFLTKPVDFKKLRDLVEEFLPRQEGSSGWSDRSGFSFPPDSGFRHTESISFQQRIQPTQQQRLKTGDFSPFGGRFRGPGSRLAES